MTADALAGTLQLQDRLRASYGEGGEAAAANVRLWLEGGLPFVPESALRDFLDNAPLDAVYESFWRNLPFGTGGVRGTVGFGPNRINPTVVALTIQAHCDVLAGLFASGQAAGRRRAVVIANDVREFHDVGGRLAFLASNPYHARTGTPGCQVTSRSMAYLAAGVYARNGFTVYLLRPEDDRAFLTTPELSFLIRRLKAAGGINMSASHNPPDDNGVKVYDWNGGQFLPPHDQDLTERATGIHAAASMPYREAVSASLVRDIPAEALEAYLSVYLDRARERGLSSAAGTPVLFTPLAGCGGRTVRVGLERLGYRVITPADQGPDGTFSAIPMRIANPEVPESTGPAKAAADVAGASLVLASDPDADRLGVEVRHRGRWRHLTGNQIATVLAYHLLLDSDGPQLRGGVYQTVVTTLAVEAIARRAGCRHVVADLLIGFKYVGQKVLEHERANPGAGPETLLSFAAEESHGYLDTPHLRDKDAMAGALYLAKLHERLTADGRTLIDYLDAVHGEVGDFGDRGRSLAIGGSAGVRAIQQVMSRLRAGPPAAIGGLAVRDVADRRDPRFGEITSDTDREARNLLVFSFDGGRLSLRPSGTEPKLKFYVQTRGAPTGSTAQTHADGLARAAYRDLLAVLDQVWQQDMGLPDPGYAALTDAFADLPDVVPLEGKVALQRDVAAGLRERLASTGQSPELTARWLARQVGAVVPGVTGWAVAAPALAATAGQWDAAQARAAHEVFSLMGGG